MHELIFGVSILTKTPLICETSWNRLCFGSLILSNLRQRIIVQFWSPLMYFLWLYSVSSHIGGLTKPICSEKSNWVNPSNFAINQVKIDSSTINSWFDTHASKPILPIGFFSKAWRLSFGTSDSAIMKCGRSADIQRNIIRAVGFGITGVIFGVLLREGPQGLVHPYMIFLTILLSQK